MIAPDLTLAEVARRANVGISTARQWAAAAEYRAEVEAGERLREDVPPYLLRYLDLGFPLPRRYSERIVRVPARAFERWASRRDAGGGG